MEGYTTPIPRRRIVVSWAGPHRCTECGRDAGYFPPGHGNGTILCERCLVQPPKGRAE